MKRLVAALAVVGMSVALFAGCGSTATAQKEQAAPAATESVAEAATESVAEAAAESVAEAAAESTEDSNAEGSYKIVVKDAKDGSGVEGAMVQLCSDTQCMMGNTDKDGVAVFDQEPGDYTAHLLRAPEGYEGSEEEIHLTADEHVATYEISAQ